MAASVRPEPRQIYRNLLIDSTRWDGYRPRKGDLIISTPPKTGTTWMQMICALLIFQTDDLYQPLSLISPWLDFAAAPIEEVLAGLERQTHRRFIKTHTPFDGLPYFDGVTYLCVGRDPRDAFLSFDNHFRNMDPGFVGRVLRERGVTSEDGGALSPPDPEREQDLCALFRTWIADAGPPWRPDGPPGASTVLSHVQSFWRVRHLPNIHLLHYSDLQTDLEGEIRRLAGLLGIVVQEERWPQLVEAASFQSMKRRADLLAPDAEKGIWRENSRFFHQGKSGQWRAVLGEEELDLYHRAMRERLEPELIRWLEHGRLGGAA